MSEGEQEEDAQTNTLFKMWQRHREAVDTFRTNQPEHYRRWEQSARAIAAQLDSKEDAALALQLEHDIFGAALCWLQHNRKRASPPTSGESAVDKITYKRLDDQRAAAARVANDYYKHARREKLTVKEVELPAAGALPPLCVPGIVMPGTRPLLEQFGQLHGLDVTLACMGVKRQGGPAAFVAENQARVVGNDALMAAPVRALADENGFPFEIYISPNSPDAISATGDVGLRVCVLLHFVSTVVKQKEGFMKDCYSSGRPIGRNLNWAVKDEQKLRSWGLINEQARFGKLEVPEDGVSGKGCYTNAAGDQKSFQMSTCISRNRTTEAELTRVLRKVSRSHYAHFLAAYFEAIELISAKYSAFLSVGQDLITAEMTAGAKFPRPKLHTQIVDSDRKFGSICFHLDSHAAFSNIITNTDVFPPGFHDFRGGQYVDGCSGYAQAPERRGVRLTRGDKRAHFVLPPLPPVGTAVAPLPALRFGMVHSPEHEVGAKLAGLVHDLKDHHLYMTEQTQRDTVDAYWLGLEMEHQQVVAAMLGVPGVHSGRTRGSASGETHRSRELARLEAPMARLRSQLESGGRYGNRIALYSADGVALV